MIDMDILIAEDDLVIRRLEERLLQKNGYIKLRLACDGKEALQLFYLKPPDLLILDYLMPHKTGYEVLKEIRSNSDYNHIPIIFVTAVDDKSKLIEALNAGATDYITKPFDQAEYLARVNAHARNYFLQKELRQTNEKLEMLNNQLREKNEQIQSDLNTARKIQEALLPKTLPDFQNLDIHFLYQASNTVGGDFINIFRLGKNKAGFYIADVSGHGVTSALVTVFIREQINHILRNYSRHLLSPAKILSQLNINFHKEANFIQDGIYLTIFWGILDLEKYTLSFSSAGHHAIPLIIDKNKNIIELSDMDIAIGFLEDFTYRNQVIQLGKNQKILFHTDGIIEIASQKQELYGMERLKKSLINNYNLLAEDLMQKLVDNAVNFSEKKILDDDIALILFELK